MLEVPLDQPLDAELPSARRSRDQILDEAQALLETYAGVQITSRLERARSAGPAIVEEAARREAEVVILGAPRTKVQGRQADLRAHRGLRPAERADAGRGRRRQAGRLGAVLVARILSVILIALGIGLIVRTIAGGVGGGVGLFVGALLIVAGVLRLYLSTRVRG